MEAIQLCHDAKLGGADAVILVPPYYFRLPDESIYAHFEAVARDAGLPVVIYNNPLYTGNNMSPELIGRISNIPGIIASRREAFPGRGRAEASRDRRCPNRLRKNSI
jgi:4-hydroxy-tetrahydrodipicolinate synthase